ncbi:putative cinnamoyl-CoA reductase [Nemania serpens]|nr:putative cinnamoyl-CoA reductase [Nemania serpens]
MSSPTLLLTGATGFVGFKVLLNALEQGYTIRAAVRSSSKSESLSSHPKVKALAKPGQLSFVEVPDVTDQEAYFEAIKGVTYVIHLAAPLPSPFLDPQTGIYEPSIKSTLSMLHAAIKESSVKKVVIASSEFANIPYPPNADRITADSRVPDIPGPYEDMVFAYSAGKVAALNATDKFVRDNNPSFKVVNVFPGFIFGTDDRALKEPQELLASTNRMLLGVITSQDAPGPMPSGSVHVYDAARVFISALNDDAPSNIGAVTPHNWDDAWDVVQKNFPGAVKDGIFTKGSQPTFPVNWDSHQTEKHFGFQFKSYKDMVVDVAGQFLELSGKGKN